MTIRRITAPILYAHSAPGRWFLNMTAAMDEAAAGLCRMYWQQGQALALHRARRDLPSGKAR